MPTTEFEGCNPILPVSDLPRSVEYYVEKLGFSVDWGTPGVITAVSRGAPEGPWLDMHGRRWAQSPDGWLEDDAK